MKKTDSAAAFLPIGVAMGVSTGTAIGVATDNLALWLSLGVAIGAGMGSALMGAAMAKAKKDDGPDASRVAVAGDANNEGPDLHHNLEAARDLLLAHGDKRWADNFDRAARLLADDEAKGIEAVLGFFGGAGSLTDRLPIDDGPHYNRLKALVDRAHDLAYRRRKALGL